MASLQKKGEGVSWPSNTSNPTEGHLSFPPKYFMDQPQAISVFFFFELAEVLGGRVTMEEGKKTQWLSLWEVGEGATQGRGAGQTARSTSLSLHIEESSLGP